MFKYVESQESAMKATRLEQIENKVKRLRELMGGDKNAMLQQSQPKNVLGITRLRRA